MADLKKLIKDYLKKERVMQLATSVNNKPWACNIHFYADDDFNIYWISTPTKRHSEEIAQNSNVAMTIKIHEDTSDEQYVIGLSAEGKAVLVNQKDIEKIGKVYGKKLNKPASLLKDIISGNNPHKFYRLKVTKFVLFDNKNFLNNPRQEYKP